MINKFSRYPFLFRSVPLQYKQIRWHQIDWEPEKKIPEQPQKSLFSSMINEILNEDQTKELEKNTDMKIQSKQKEDGLRSYKKLENFELKKQDYNDIMKENPHGKFHSPNLKRLRKNTKFTLIGGVYNQIPVKNIYKMISYTKPSTIVLQVRPDSVLKSIDVNPKNEKTNKFSNRLYFSQLFHPGYSIMPSNQVRNQVYKNLLANGLFVDLKEENTQKKYKPYSHNERLNDEAIGVACLYAENHNMDVVLGEVPDLIYRQNIANSLTLMQLQNIFTHCSREIALYPDLQPQTPFTMACYLYPEIFLRPSDRYISSLLEYLIHKKHKNILVLAGNNQSDSIMKYLDHRKAASIEEDLKIVPLKENIIRGIQPEEILEKHSLLDVLFNGKEILKNMENINFKTTYEMINKYHDPLHIDSSRLQNFRVLHYQFLTKYQSFCEKEYENGKLIMRREFLSKMNI